MPDVKYQPAFESIATIINTTSWSLCAITEKIFLNENLVFSPYTTFFSLVESTHMVEKSTSIIPHIPAQREKPVAL